LPYPRKRLTDFDEIWHIDASGASAPNRLLKFPEFENPRWRTAAIFEKSKNCHISSPYHETCSANLYILIWRLTYLNVIANAFRDYNLAIFNFCCFRALAYTTLDKL